MNMRLKDMFQQFHLIPTGPRFLGFVGAIPFLFLAGLPWFQSYHAVISLYALAAYGAVILSFIGALHWAFAMMDFRIPESRRSRIYLWSVIPALIGWISLILPLRIGLLILLIGFVLHWIMDIK